MLHVLPRCVAVFLALAPGVAGATGISMNNIALPGLPIEACLQRAEGALGSVGLTNIRRTNEAAWADGPAGSLYTVYCLSRSGVAVVIGAADAAAAVDQTISRLRQAMAGSPMGGASK